MRVRLNLASNPLQSHRRFLAGSGLLGVVGLIAFVGLGWNVYVARQANAEMRGKTAAIENQVVQMQRQRETLERFFALPENNKLHDRAAFVNGLIDARSFNWTLMFMDLEKILPPGVRIVSIEPKQDQGHIEVKFTVGATSDDANLKFIKALEDSKSFSHVELVAVHTPTSGTGGDPVVAELTAEYSRI
jgi:type IV pilus assembly protein PilN